MGGLNLEVFKFGMYIMFPIGIMYYFGTNLDERFSVPDFWPKPEQSHRVPTDRDEIQAELARLRARRLYHRDRRLEDEQRAAGPPETDGAPTARETRAVRAAAGDNEVQRSGGGAGNEKKGWFW